jgi:hypothetical protein
MKKYPLGDTEYSYMGDRITVDLLLTTDGSFGVQIVVGDHTTLNLEVNQCPMQNVQEFRLGLFGQDSRDFITALRALLALADRH